MKLKDADATELDKYLKYSPTFIQHHWQILLPTVCIWSFLVFFSNVEVCKLTCKGDVDLPSHQAD